MPLGQFLALCGSTVGADPLVRAESHSGALLRARDLFVRAGLDALAAQPTGGDWLQVGIRLPTDPARRRELHKRIARLARKLLRDRPVDNFFYMNKAPGMRLRFQLASERADHVPDVLHAEVERWRSAGLVEAVEPGTYEPESQLFGGPISMGFAHALFTLDSLVWLDFHASPKASAAGGSPAWLVSLAILRAVFDGLDITGWEDLGVWEHVRNATGRRLPLQATALPMYGDVAAEMRAVWSRGDQLVERLDPAIGAIVADHEEAFRTAAAQWRVGYFNTSAAYLGPRAVAAFFVIFHWNRAALSAVQQALLAESLAGRVV
jgi:thiopeptide-type bacteriocin biosynthesis protein